MSAKRMYDNVVAVAGSSRAAAPVRLLITVPILAQGDVSPCPGPSLKPVLSFPRRAAIHLENGRRSIFFCGRSAEKKGLVTTISRSQLNAEVSNRLLLVRVSRIRRIISYALFVIVSHHQW